MLHRIVHYALTLSLLVKAVSTYMKARVGLDSDSLWFHVSGISSGLFVLCGVIWAIVFLHGNNLSRISMGSKISLAAAALLLALVSLIT